MKTRLFIALTSLSFLTYGTLPERGSFKSKPPTIKSKPAQPSAKTVLPKAVAIILLQKHGSHSSYTHINFLQAKRSFIERVEETHSSLYETTRNKPLSEEQQKCFYAIKARALRFAQEHDCDNQFVVTIRCFDNDTMALSTKAPATITR